ncbi:MAG TPA: methylated-DNA--[protein]-cysteine S-methyltransferase [Microvirga sp.]|jgi:O-6-methylguanine DNA methyltransferase
MHLLLDRFASPIGTILLVSDGQALRALDFHDHEERLHRLLERQYGAVTLTRGPVPQAMTGALAAYFAGDLEATGAIAVETGGTPFQRRVWAALRSIPAGTTTTYGALAAELGQPGASRAVGLANGANPVGIVVPCHRVIGANGSLTGFGGGLPRKQWLLEHEGAQLGLFRGTAA